ncbi:MAG: hypothetical protein K0S09_187 [Sphingobacteriaceae bacterium]|jgi:hypothetical protein|nr:hypothetical protein [Sphingobacteriaceae bacterium]
MKQILKTAFVIIPTVLFYSSCSTGNKIAALKPAPEYNSTQVVYDKQVSFVNLPVELSIADIQTQTNKYLNGLIYEDNDMNGDNLMLKVWKQAPIVVTEAGGKLHMELPLKIWTRVKYGVEKFGLSAYDTRDLNLNGVIKLNTTANLTNNWKLATNTQIEGIEWKESPSVSVMGKNVPITYLINPALAVFKSRMAKIIDNSIAESFDIKPYVVTALEEVSKPVEVNSEYHTWFAMQPLELYASKATIANKKVTINLGMKSYLETSVGSKPTLTFDKNKLALKVVDKMPAEFNANIAGFVRYADAAALMQKNFTGQKFESGGKSVTVNHVDLWGKDDKIIVQLGMSGSLNGDVYLSGVPQYDPAKKEIYLNQVDFVLDSKNKLLKAGDWLVHGIILKKIEQNCRFSISEQLNEGQKTMATYLNGYQPMKGVKVYGSMTELAPNKIFLTPNAIVAMVVAKGKVAISIDGME